ncbi:ABC transporter permease subunit [Halostella litorea]|uniref:ABC transporter permease subunit n=1 Tax=Halostella litorea TaxID=2528831 RepID=UPI0010923DC5|nr:ABC transporter permease subunit [Halostella litorea]
MSVADVLRKDFKDVRRAKLVWAPALVYTAFMLLFFWGQSQSPNPDFYQILWGLVGIGGALLVPLLALVAAYLSIAGERESGSIKFLLGLPNTRSDVVLGKVLSRSAVVTAGILVSFAVGVPVAAVLVPDMTFEYGEYALFAAVTVLYALAYVAVAVAISAATASRSRAMSGAIGFFFVFNLVWNFLPVGPVQMIAFLSDEFGVEVSDSVTELVYSISPTGAYLNGILKLIMPDRFNAQAGAVVADPPFYIQGWFMVLILVAWIVVPLAIGTWRFQRAELG